MQFLIPSLLTLLILFGGMARASAQAPIDSAAHQSVGLVLSGGGAKGIAHIGVIRALEENNIPINYVAGTSMGAIVGGLYACGYTTDEMMALILSQDFAYWSTGVIDPKLNFYLNRTVQTPAMLTVPLDFGKQPAATMPQSLISPLPMNFAFMELFSPFTAQCKGDFDRLMVPFRCVASDVDAKRKKVLSGGSVGDAIRASMSFPAVFQPTEIDGTLLYDGGIYDNFPVDVMRGDFAPSIMIGVDVSAEDSGPQNTIIDQLSNLIIQNNNYTLPPEEGIKIRIDLDQFTLLDFPKARQIYEIGYRHGCAMMDSIKARVHTRTDSTTVSLRRDVFKSLTPRLAFDSVGVGGASAAQNRFVGHLFRRQMRHGELSIAGARKAYYTALSTSKLANLELQASQCDSNALFDLRVKATVKNNFKASVGGYITSSNNSYLFLSAGYSTLSFNSVSANLNFWLGQSDIAATATADIFLPTSVPSRLSAIAVASRRKYYDADYMFYETKVPWCVVMHQYFSRVSWSCQAGFMGRFETGVGYGHLGSSYNSDTKEVGYAVGRYRTSDNLAQAFAAFETSTLNDVNYPTLGNHLRLTAMGFSGTSRLRAPDDSQITRDTPAWAQVEMVGKDYLSLGRRWSLGFEADVMLSTRKLYGSYYSSLVSAPAYTPTPASNNTFNPDFRANGFVGLAVVPVYKYSDNLSVRVFPSAFIPMRKINRLSNGAAAYGPWLSSLRFYGEADVTFRFPFASLTAYANYASSQWHRWGVGLTFGIYLKAPDFLR